MENKIEKKLTMYSLFDKNTEIYDGLVMGFDDKATIDYYLSQFKSIILSFDDDKFIEYKNKFIDKLKSSCIYSLGYFDNLKGEFVNEKKVLVDLFNISLKNGDFIFTNENENNESED